MSQFFQGTTAGSLPPSVPTSFVTDDATIAVPVANILNVFTPGNGTQGISTSASGNTITITLTETTISGTGTTVDGDTADLIAITPVDMKSFTVQGLVTGYDVTNDLMIGGEIIGNGRRNGTVTIVGTPDRTKDEDATLNTAMPTAATFNIVASGSTFVLRVTGASGHTIAWRGIINYIQSP